MSYPEGLGAVSPIGDSTGRLTGRTGWAADWGLAGDWLGDWLGDSGVAGSSLGDGVGSGSSEIWGTSGVAAASRVTTNSSDSLPSASGRSAKRQR